MLVYTGRGVVLEPVVISLQLLYVLKIILLTIVGFVKVLALGLNLGLVLVKIGVVRFLDGGGCWVVFEVGVLDIGEV